MTDFLPRSVIEPANPKLNVSRNANLPHSPGIRVGDYIFLSGMGPVDWSPGGATSARLPSRSARRCVTSGTCSNSAGSSLNRVVKVTVVLADSGDYDELNRVWREFFPADPPARTTCALQLSNGNGVEIECIALAGQGPS